MGGLDKYVTCEILEFLFSVSFFVSTSSPVDKLRQHPIDSKTVIDQAIDGGDMS